MIIIIRRARKEDLSRITEIYNEAVLHSVATLDTFLRDKRGSEKWYKEHNENYPILVAEGDSDILGWISLSRWSDKLGYNPTVEISIYVDKEYRDKGIGKRLFEKGIQLGKSLNYHTIISRIAGDNEKSIYLHKKYGFNHIGTMKEVGYKFSRYIDVDLYQLILD